jgi:hypothetical protein
VGSVDPHTAMWMRDALLNKRFRHWISFEPVGILSISLWTVFWVMVGKTWGDTVIIPFSERQHSMDLKKLQIQYSGSIQNHFPACGKVPMKFISNSFLKTALII